MERVRQTFSKMRYQKLKEETVSLSYLITTIFREFINDLHLIK